MSFPVILQYCKDNFLHGTVPQNCSAFWTVGKPSNAIVNDNKQLLNCNIIYYHNNIAIINDISNLRKKKCTAEARTSAPFERPVHSPVLYPLIHQTTDSKNSKSRDINITTIVYYCLLSRYCRILSFSYYRFHYRNNIAILGGLTVGRSLVIFFVLFPFCLF